VEIGLDKLRSKPWSEVAPNMAAELMLPKGFITEEERRCYHYLAQHCVSGEGQIVDAGACLGASAFCFASGLARNPTKGDTLVHSFDQFLVTENYVADMISEYFRPVQPDWGDNFFDIFEFQTGKYKNLIIPHKGNFLNEKWNCSPISILFIDIAKSFELHNHLIEQFYPCLMPGKTLLIHQDFYFCWLPFIHITMQYLSHRFEIVDPFIPSASRLYLLKDAVSGDEITHIASISREERLDLLDAFIDGEHGDLRAMARVTKMCQLWYDKDQRSYDQERGRLIAEFGLRPDTNWGNQCIELDKLGFDRP